MLRPTKKCVIFSTTPKEFDKDKCRYFLYNAGSIKATVIQGPAFVEWYNNMLAYIGKVKGNDPKHYIFPFYIPEGIKLPLEYFKFVYTYGAAPEFSGYEEALTEYKNLKSKVVFDRFGGTIKGDFVCYPYVNLISHTPIEGHRATICVNPKNIILDKLTKHNDIHVNIGYNYNIANVKTLFNTTKVNDSIYPLGDIKKFTPQFQEYINQPHNFIIPNNSAVYFLFSNHLDYSYHIDTLDCEFVDISIHVNHYAEKPKDIGLHIKDLYLRRELNFKGTNVKKSSITVDNLHIMNHDSYIRIENCNIDIKNVEGNINAVGISYTNGKLNVPYKQEEERDKGFYKGKYIYADSGLKSVSGTLLDKYIKELGAEITKKLEQADIVILDNILCKDGKPNKLLYNKPELTKVINSNTFLQDYIKLSKNKS